VRQGTKLSAPARHLISSILVLLVAPFPGAHGTANSDAGAIYLVAATPPPPGPNSYLAALYSIGAQRKLLLIRDSHSSCGSENRWCTVK